MKISDLIKSHKYPLLEQKKGYYLSHNAKKGWDIVKLNIFQRLMRKVFGAYKDTHLTYIAKQWNDVTIKNQVKQRELSKFVQINTQIHNIWSKAHPDKSFPQAMLLLGNAKPEEAELFCFPQIEGDQTGPHVIGNFIKKYYRPGDEILIDEVTVNETIISQE